ncbi:MmcQ/YjbR family DNA-binding protein [Streptomyces sp. NPDC006261]|uniref:MmcQ/YjbR family DNA-binding protein n=1 Tax=Streptomyces sp. NPDC006261 TaxID=3156739 RepID=UPI0033BF549E
MNGKKLQETARERAQSLPGAKLVDPFGPEWEVFEVHSKMFLLMTEAPGLPVVILKSEPEEAEALRAAHADITPGYHMNKKHWITLSAGKSLTPRLVEDLVINSYRLVVAGLPKAEQPVDPKTFGGRAARSQ